MSITTCVLDDHRLFVFAIWLCTSTRLLKFRSCSGDVTFYRQYFLMQKKVGGLCPSWIASTESHSSEVYFSRQVEHEQKAPMPTSSVSLILPLETQSAASAVEHSSSDPSSSPDLANDRDYRHWHWPNPWTAQKSAGRRARSAHKCPGIHWRQSKIHLLCKCVRS